MTTRPYQDFTDDRPPLQAPVDPTIATRGGQPPDQARKMFAAIVDRVSSTIAGGARTAVGAFRPDTGQMVDTNEGFMPSDYLDQIVAPVPYPFEGANGAPDDFDFSGLQAGGAVKEGKGMDFFRTGEAPDNFANRNHPLYRKRAEFASAMHSMITSQFRVSGTAGYYREPDPSHAAPGGPSANSDHYSAGAIDYFGTPGELDRLRNWLIEQPWVSFVRWRTESHHDHVHVSFNLAWIRDNYGGGGVPFTPPAPTAGPTAQASNTPGTSTSRSDQEVRIT